MHKACRAALTWADSQRSEGIHAFARAHASSSKSGWGDGIMNATARCQPPAENETDSLPKGGVTCKVVPGRRWGEWRTTPTWVWYVLVSHANKPAFSSLRSHKLVCQTATHGSGLSCPGRGVQSVRHACGALVYECACMRASVRVLVCFRVCVHART